MMETATQFIPTRNCNTKYQCPWWNDKCRDAMRERGRAQNRMRRDPYSEFLRIEYRRAKAKARRTVREAQAGYIERAQAGYGTGNFMEGAHIYV